MLILIASIVLLGLAASVAAPWIRYQLDFDRCLDQGGEFDRQTGRCLKEPVGE
ncbi:hypothetical protein [Arhodomonas sp. AD133]|uniref:hypothetical protein n=1 Tax=Arhodomonas sp. AD133 TaxID=3415009 RepID=UPI003EC14AB9